MSDMAQPCRHRWLERQGLPVGEAEPCGECDPCTSEPPSPPDEVFPTDKESVVREVRAAIADGDRERSDRILRHAVHVGLSATELFLAGGQHEPQPARRTTKKSNASEE